MPAKIEILHAQAQRFEQAQSGPEKKLRDESIRIAELGQQQIDLVARQHHRQAFGTMGTHDARNLPGIDLEHLLVEKKNRAEGLVLRRGTDMALDRQVRKKSVDLRR